MLNWADLPKKSPKKLREQIEQGLTCTVEGCNDPLTQKTGPGSDKFCKKHQKRLREVGGMARGDRLHTMERGEYCEICGYTPAEDPEIIEAAEGDPIELNRHARSQLDVNHIDGDHENNDPDNLQTVCLKHHRIITIKNKHYTKRS